MLDMGPVTGFMPRESLAKFVCGNDGVIVGHDEFSEGDV